MKNRFIKLLALALCLSLAVSFCSCKKDDKSEETTEKKIITEKYSEEIISTNPEGVEYEYFFESVEALTTAMKKDTNKYNGATVKVTGTLYKRDNQFYLVDYTATSANVPNTGSSLQDRYEFHKKLNTSDGKIEIYISNEAQHAVAETGDYVKLYGTIRMPKEGVFLGSCEYNLIATLDERIEMVTQ